MLALAFVTKSNPSKRAEPRQGSLHDVTRFAHAAAVLRLRSSFGSRFEQSHDPHVHHRSNRPSEAIRRIALQHSWVFQSKRLLVQQRWSCLQHGFNAGVVTFVSGTGLHNQGHTFGICNHMPFAAFFRPIHRVGTGVRPPFTARTLALSMTSRSRFSIPWLPSISSNRPWALVQTPAADHWWKRRQHVEPEPHPISLGSDCHRMPSRSTNSNPTRHLRSSTAGLPPLGERFRTGKCREIASQSSSVSNCDMASAFLARGKFDAIDIAAGEQLARF